MNDPKKLTTSELINRLRYGANPQAEFLSLVEEACIRLESYSKEGRGRLERVMPDGREIRSWPQIGANKE